MRTLTEVDRSERLRMVEAAREFPEANPTREPLEFHRRLPGYAPSRLVEAPGIAGRLGLDRLWVKDESSRMGLPAFKIMGASWAVYRAASEALRATTGEYPAEWSSIDDLAAAYSPLKPLTLTCATDGNHGRAVARMAKLLGFGARIFVPSDMAEARIAAIASEGAEVVRHDGTYDEAVARAAAEAGERMLVIADTSWPGYEDVPRWVIEGYSTILWEVDDALDGLEEAGPDLVAVQIGVGALAAAVVRHFRRPGRDGAPFILGVEPTHAACAMASIEAGEIVEVPGPHDSIMSGLNCGIPSPIAWPLVSRGIDAFIAVEDERARQAVRALAAEGIVAGECGAAGLAGLMTWAESFGGDLSGKRALVITTEGATDPEAYRRIVEAS
ncbi:MAG: diaminopropionate ammonia-lyase [Thermomicrobiales bacterium]|nr:diaminopropionate ammonia-lyase [Thermomicrobiales bacterium]